MIEKKVEEKPLKISHMIVNSGNVVYDAYLQCHETSVKELDEMNKSTIKEMRKLFAQK